MNKLVDKETNINSKIGNAKKIQKQVPMAHLNY